ncbi:hypothetical protein R1sor_025611 [Riccia sorocarpa]|uniref:Uncharacterized protein n=1 Tax=Riccia sorocarpa TaxID=122646 RepID=A0ABD3G946_9MARC
MPYTSSIERRIVLRAPRLQQNVIMSLQNLLAKCDDLLASIPNSFMLELKATEGKIDISLRHLWDRSFSKVHESKSQVCWSGTSCKSSHARRNTWASRVQGTSPGIIPDTTGVSVMDELVSVIGEEALTMARRLGLEEGLLVGISSGSAMAGSLKVAKKPENVGK